MKVNLDLIEGHFAQQFDDLYDELRGAFRHPMEWMGHMIEPPWWRLRRRWAWRKVEFVFALHGFILTDHLARQFLAQPGQYPDEDAGGAIVRKLRQTFQYQTGVPFDWSQRVCRGR